MLLLGFQGAGNLQPSHGLVHICNGNTMGWYTFVMVTPPVSNNNCNNCLCMKV